MGFEMKPNSGSVFEVEKEGNPNRPDMKGKARIGDVAVWVSGWWNESRNGPYLALKFEEMTEEQVQKYMPEHLPGRGGSPAPRSRPDNSALIRSVQERARQMGKQNAARRPPAGLFKDDAPADDDIPF